MVYVPEMPRVDAAGAVGSGFDLGQSIGSARTKRKAKNALQRIYEGDKAALADLMAADPEAGRQVDTQMGIAKYVNQGMPAQELAGPTKGGEALTTESVTPSVDVEGLTAYLASRGDSGALKALMEKAGPEGKKWLGTTVRGADGRIYAIEQGSGLVDTGVMGEQEAPKAPTTRTFNVGGKSVTQEYDAAAGRWVTIADAPRELPKPEKPEDPRANLDYEIKLGNNYQRESESFKTVRQAKDNVDSALAQNSAAGDLAAATSIMKLLDPGSVVRESELGMAMNATGLFGRIGNYAEMIQSGQRLNPEQRKEMLALASQLFDTADKYQGQTKKRYVDMANQYQLNPRNILGADYMPEGGQQSGGIPPIPPGIPPIPEKFAAGRNNPKYVEYWIARHQQTKADGSPMTDADRRRIDERARQNGVIK